MLTPLPSQPLPSNTSQASFVSALAMEEESSMETEKTAEPGPVTRQPHVMACYQNYLAQYQVFNWSVKQPNNKRTSKSSLHRPLDLDTPTSEESPASFDHLYIDSMVHFVSIRHPTAILDDLHGKSQTAKQEHKLSKTEGTTPVCINISPGQTDLSVKPDNVKIKGLQANVSIPKVNLCLLQASVEEGLPLGSVKCVTHVSLVALCFDRIATQFRMNRGIVEETPSTAEHGRPSVMLEKYASATKMQPQSSGSLRSNAGIEKGKEIAARLNIHRIHSQLRGLDST
ncbi:hypothetical protein CRUP_024400, partial [Coryphaenoides rupestris]